MSLDDQLDEPLNVAGYPLNELVWSFVASFERACDVDKAIEDGTLSPRLSAPETDHLNRIVAASTVPGCYPRSTPVIKAAIYYVIEELNELAVYVQSHSTYWYYAQIASLEEPATRLWEDAGEHYMVVTESIVVREAWRQAFDSHVSLIDIVNYYGSIHADDLTRDLPLEGEQEDD